MSSIETCDHRNQAPRDMLAELPITQAGTEGHKCAVCAYAAGAETSRREPGSFNPKQVVAAIRAHQEFLTRSRATFPHIPDALVGRTEFPTAPYYFAQGHAVTFRFEPPLDSETARAIHETGQWINENFVVRLCAVLDSHGVTGKGIDNQRDLPGYPELRLARKLRNVFAHGSGRCNSANSDHQRLRAEIIKRFGLKPEDCPEGWFPLPIESVLLKLAQRCAEYVVALAATRPSV